MSSRRFFQTSFFLFVFGLAIGMNEGFGYDRFEVLRYSPQPYSPAPLFPGQTPVGYYLNRPLYDYDPNIGVFPADVFNPYSMLPNVHNRVYHPSRKIADFNEDGESDAIRPHYVKAYPQKPTKDEYTAGKPEIADKSKSEHKPIETRTWKTKEGIEFENAYIVGIVDGRLCLKTRDGKWFYVAVNDLDADSTKALDEWRRREG